MRSLLLTCLLFASSLLYPTDHFFAFFKPPSEWLISQTPDKDENIMIGFVQSKRKIFTPAVSLSSEAFSCDEATYLTAVKKNHQADLTKIVREMGIVKTQSGPAHLMQIDMKSTWGDIRILQAILLKEKKAYILTGTCLKEDFLSLGQTLIQSFQTFSLSPSLIDSASDSVELEMRIEKLQKGWRKYLATAKGDKKKLFKEPFFQNQHWIPFTRFIEKEYANKGSCWQLLALQYVKQILMEL